MVKSTDEKVTMADFLAELRGSETASSQDRSTNDSNRDRASSGSRGDVVYLQSQDGNLSKELLPLLPNVGTHVPIASEALGMIIHQIHSVQPFLLISSCLRY
jgi:hypothetical protein